MKHALVTGGSRGIGRAVCIRLSEMGLNVLINYLSNKEEAEKTLAMIHEKGGTGELLPFNVANREETDKALEGWIASHPGEYIEVLVNNAGIRKDNLIMWMKPEEWDSVLHTNLDSFFNVTRVLVREMLVKKFGRIVNVVSVSGITGLPGQTNYSAAKAGMIGATKALSQEVARRNVTVNAVAPGFISTDMVSDLKEEDFKKIIPMKRFGKPEEVADLIAFIASDKSSYITGQVISINGGLPY